MRELGLKAYRFSVAWGRVLPEGRGRVNAAGLGLLRAPGRRAAGSRHRSRWPRCTTGTCRPRSTTAAAGSTRDIADWFADYASVMFRALDDRVKLWATLNEPWVVTDGGYLHGALAPGHRNLFEAPIASHHLLRAHGKAVQAYRARGKHADRPGRQHRAEVPGAATSAADRARAAARAHAYMNRQYLDPVLLGRYPDEMRRDLRRRRGPNGRAEDER